MSTPLHVEGAVRSRYSEAARETVQALCCPIEYDRAYLKVIPAEVIERDYGCGDPSKHLRAGETVLDLGSGTGKLCFIAAQAVGPTGRVIGVDMNDDMLAIARQYAPVVGNAIGFHNVEFRKGRIQDLALDLEKLDADLKANPIRDAGTFLAAEGRAEELRITAPLVANDSIDVVISNCVLNLVEPRAKTQLFGEIFRVLRKGGRAVISDIVSDEMVPAELQNDPELWSGCISGALTEQAFIRAFVDAGFYGARILKRDPQPWRTVRGIEFRSMTIEAFKGKQGECFERNQAVIYKGPFQEVLDDDGHRMERGQRYAVCDKTFQLFSKAPYRDCFDFVEPHQEIPLQEAQPFARPPGQKRHPRETKGQDFSATTEKSQCCDGGCC
ncbi:MAG TPA: methyltransferase domain-containing protein [Methylomirabilota bacterium]|nr:methyltransferase domain-containing protein [Methylomirabilota bacterium]